MTPRDTYTNHIYTVRWAGIERRYRDRLDAYSFANELMGRGYNVVMDIDEESPDYSIMDDDQYDYERSDEEAA